MRLATGDGIDDQVTRVTRIAYADFTDGHGLSRAEVLIGD